MRTKTKVPAAFEGGCLCGALRYRCEGEPLTLYTCHCTDCQRQTGSAFGMSLMILRDKLQLLRGTPQTFTKRFADDGREKYAKFCGECGARVWVEFSQAPQVANIKPGTLDDTTWLEPIGQIWTRSAQPWVNIPTGPLCFEGQPASMLPLIEAWQTRGRS
ncbi:MAG TPA: GFA family protein [Polyangiales bacterium]